MSRETLGHAEFCKQAHSAERISAVFAFLPEDEISFRHPIILERTFLEMSREFPEQFGSMSFGKPGSLIKSEQVRETRLRLERSGLSTYTMNPGRISVYFDRVGIRNNLSQLDNLNVDEDVSARFLELLNHFDENTPTSDIFVKR